MDSYDMTDLCDRLAQTYGVEAVIEHLREMEKVPSASGSAILDKEFGPEEIHEIGEAFYDLEMDELPTDEFDFLKGSIKVKAWFIPNEKE